MMTDTQLGELKGLHQESCIIKPELYLNGLQDCLIRAQTEGNIIHLMKQPVMCGNSSSAAAVSTQRQHSYGLCLEGKVAKWSASMV